MSRDVMCFRDEYFRADDDDILTSLSITALHLLYLHSLLRLLSVLQPIIDA